MGVLFLLVKINKWSFIGNLQDFSRTANQNCAPDVDGQEAQQHHTRLEHVSPDHSFHAPLLQRQKNHTHLYRWHTLIKTPTGGVMHGEFYRDRWNKCFLEGSIGKK